MGLYCLDTVRLVWCYLLFARRGLSWQFTTVVVAAGMEALQRNFMRAVSSAWR